VTPRRTASDITDDELDMLYALLDARYPVKSTSMFVARFAVPYTQPKQRHRDGRGGRKFTPKETRGAETAVGWAFRRATPGWAVDTTTRFGLHLAVTGASSQADVDNLAKTVMDGLQSVAYRNDCQVDELHVRRLPGRERRTEITIYRIEGVLVPRIRTIKPEFFTSLTIADLTLEARLTFIGLWTHVDDEGRCVDDARLVKAAIWPLDDRAAGEVDADLRALSESSLITRYTVEGRSYLEVSGWREHQKINRPTPSKLPGPHDGDTAAPVSAPGRDETTATSAVEDSPPQQATVEDDSLIPHGALTTGKERNREQGTGNTPSLNGSAVEPAPDRPSPPKPGSDADPYWRDFWDAYPRRVAKKAARAKFAAACRRADPAAIVDGARRYRDDTNRVDRFTKHPTTWLEGDCWDDPPLPPRTDADGHQPYRNPEDLSVYAGEL
jgi:Holliday junction resolvase RusA-like endonuclease